MAKPKKTDDQYPEKLSEEVLNDAAGGVKSYNTSKSNTTSADGGSTVVENERTGLVFLKGK